MREFAQFVKNQIQFLRGVLLSVCRKVSKAFLDGPILPQLKKTHAFMQSVLRRIALNIKLFLFPLGNPLIRWIGHCWHVVKQWKFRGQSIGVLMDQVTAKSNAFRVRVGAQLSQYEWVGHLLEASQYGTWLSTLVTTCFANLLALAFPLMLMQVYDRVIPNQSINTLVVLSIGVIVCFVIEIVLRAARSYINIWADTKYEYVLGKTAFNKLIDTPLYLYEKTDAGTRLKQFAVLDQMKGFYNNQLLSAIFDTPFLIIFLIVIAYIGNWLFLVPLIVISMIAVASYYFIRQGEKILGDKISYESREGDFILNVLSNIHTAKCMGMEELLMRRYERLQKTGTRVNWFSSIYAGDLTTLKMVAGQFIVILMATVGSFFVMDGSISIGSLSACILLVGRIMRPFDRILNAFNRLKMLNLIRKQLDIILQKSPEQHSLQKSAEELRGEVVLNNVGFYFEDDVSRWIIKNINLNIAPHTLVVLTGKEQSQRTIIMNILATITKPTEGQYFIDNYDVDQYQAYELRKQIAYLTRSGKLFRGTMMENLSAFDESLIPTARRFVDRLGLNVIVSRLPNGYDTMVGNKAVETLPGGIVNLMFIIRALVNKPKIILFDETNISLDVQANKKMVELLVSLKEFATIVISTDVADTIALADVVYEVVGEKINRVEYGK